MRLKIQWPAGSKVLTLDDGVTVGALLSEIATLSNLAPHEMGLKVGFPPAWPRW